MKIGLKGWNIGVLLAIGAVWFAGSTQREKPVVADPKAGDKMAVLEDKVAVAPTDAKSLRELAQTYLDARQPGMALAAIERAPIGIKTDPTVEHLYARALLDQGRSADALAAERRVIVECGDPSAANPLCSTYLIASATRRIEILEQLVQLGVEDMNAHPEAANLAYQNATRQVSLSVH